MGQTKAEQGARILRRVKNEWVKRERAKMIERVFDALVTRKATKTARDIRQEIHALDRLLNYSGIDGRKIDADKPIEQRPKDTQSPGMSMEEALHVVSERFGGGNESPDAQNPPPVEPNE